MYWKLVGTALATAIAMPVQHASAEENPGVGKSNSYTVTGNLTAASEYISRGMRASWGKPALQGAIDIIGDSGWFAGIWGSSLSSNALPNARTEWDVYAGYNGTRGDLGYSLALFGYAFPGSRSSAATGHTSFNYLELAPGVSYKWLAAKYLVTISRDYFGYNGMTMLGVPGEHTRGTGYLDLTLSVPLAAGLTGSLHYGALKVRNFSQADYHDIKVQLTKTLPLDTSFSIAYTRGWDKDGFYKHYSNGKGGPSRDILGSTYTVALTKSF